MNKITNTITHTITPKKSSSKPKTRKNRTMDFVKKFHLD